MRHTLNMKKIFELIKDKKMKKFLATFALIIISVTVIAQVTSNNELKNLISESFSYYPRMKEALNQVDIAQESLNLAKTNLPVIDGTASYEYVQPKITLPLQINGETKEFQFAPVNNVNANVGAEF